MVPPDIDQKRYKIIYLTALVLVFAGLSLARTDLFMGAFRATMQNLSAGGIPAIKVMAEILLLGAIMALTFRTVPFRIDDPVGDGVSMAVISCYAYLAEWWGTATGLWTYYTGETPPLWIIPAWPMGILVIDRLAYKIGGMFGGLLEKVNGRRIYWIWAVLFYCVFTPFIMAKLGWTGSVVPLALTAVIIFAGRRDLARCSHILLVSAFCVLLADTWGTTNHCWSYHTQTARFGMIYGITFGIFFDSFVVLAAVKTVAYIRPRLFS